MTKRISTAALHIKGAREVNRVATLGQKVAQGLEENARAFPSPPVPPGELREATNTLQQLIAEAEGGSHQKVEDRNQQSEEVLDMLRSLAAYVDSVAKGDRNLILLSGFDSSDEPNPQPIPEKIILRRIENGEAPHTAKVLIENPNNQSSFIVQVCPAPLSEEGFKTVLQATSSRRLILENLERGKEIFVRVAGLNAKGQGDWSEAASFIPN